MSSMGMTSKQKVDTLTKSFNLLLFPLYLILFLIAPPKRRRRK